MKILIAEDDTTSRLLLEATLIKLDHEVTVTCNGREAWTTFQTDYFPVFISDWMMPELDGLTVCRAIRNVHRDHYTTVILLTALGGKAKYMEAMEAGVDDFITKPFDEDELGARLRVAERFLGLRKQVKQLQGLLPICAHCKQIRDEHNEWIQLETFVSKRSEAQFSHSVCPKCTSKLFPRL